MDFTLVPNKKIIVKSFNNWFKLDVFKAALIADCQLIAYTATFIVTSAV